MNWFKNNPIAKGIFLRNKRIIALIIAAALSIAMLAIALPSAADFDPKKLQNFRIRISGNDEAVGLTLAVGAVKMQKAGGNTSVDTGDNTELHLMVVTLMLTCAVAFVALLCGKKARGKI